MPSWIHRETMREYHRRLQSQSLYEWCHLRADLTTGGHHRLLLPLPSLSHRPEMRTRLGICPRIFVSGAPWGCQHVGNAFLKAHEMVLRSRFYVHKRFKSFVNKHEIASDSKSIRK